ncbi:octanoyltransferase [Pseudonocardia sulfidoxydans NBRC 16205]|uniref:Octanoyltransferase n=1 Tax=Pseudonocardia sulfidoxydans NBRC 16205 TaxID=1223511 RepID=A0A511DLH4_9PSEU|nr:lipoyl(octanoyl) transferase LipB [Pseudonocardia sulfidoxydans]GEL23918.1 octanoyltransferase [Pseudonocardia sulfidoxydans NBRC 16205]
MSDTLTPAVTATRRARTAEGPVEVEVIELIGYLEAWDRQREHAQARRDGGPDVLMLLQHPSVYTAGKRTRPSDRPTDGTPVVDVDRGGLITWHGPGQLVGYPIIGLAEPLDVVDYVRRLEEAMIKVCHDLGLADAGRVAGRSGVWLPADAGRPERKVAAIGVRVQGGVTLHGFSLNCDADLSSFAKIVPCGITDAGVTSLSLELQRPVTVEEVRDAARDAVLAALEGTLAVADHTVERPATPAGLDLRLDPRLH